MEFGTEEPLRVSECDIGIGKVRAVWVASDFPAQPKLSLRLITTLGETEILPPTSVEDVQCIVKLLRDNAEALLAVWQGSQNAPNATSEAATVAAVIQIAGRNRDSGEPPSGSKP